MGSAPQVPRGGELPQLSLLAHKNKNKRMQKERTQLPFSLIRDDRFAKKKPKQPRNSSCRRKVALPLPHSGVWRLSLCLPAYLPTCPVYYLLW